MLQFCTSYRIYGSKFARPYILQYQLIIELWVLTGMQRNWLSQGLRVHQVESKGLIGWNPPNRWFYKIIQETQGPNPFAMPLELAF